MNGVHRLLSRREKHRDSRRETTNDVPEDRRGLFVLGDDHKKPSKDMEKKIREVKMHLETLGAHHFSEDQVDYALRADSVDGDVQKAFALLMLLEDSAAGVLVNYSPSVHMLGAINRNNCTCYLDSLLFAMFARLNSFVGILYTSFSDAPRRRLATILRLWVNMLRTGRLITVDITQQLQDSLAECGWPEAARIKQQDVSEAFTFITDKLELPLLTLKMDIFHTGREDESDDHKFVNERLLEVAIPEELVNEGTVRLEECLENYFNNRVEVKRHLSRISTLQSQQASDMNKDGGVHVETLEVPSPSPSLASEFLETPTTPRRPTMLHERTLSIFSERKVEFDVDEKVPPAVEGDSPVIRRRRKSSVRKEVLMPAWQFFSLIPWYTQNSPQSDAQIAAHFASQRPVLGICLKRYSVSSEGKSSRLDTHIDIPLDIALPHFVADEHMHDNAELHRRFKLSLRSVICHRGVQVNAGHYICLVRTDIEDHGEWMRFDDLAEQRVAPVDIQTALKDESPYLLFYQVQPITATYEMDEDLPPYESAGVALETLDQKLTNLSVNGRVSVEVTELDKSARTSAELSDGQRGRSIMSNSRRTSLAGTEASLGGNSIRAESNILPGESPAISATDAPSASGSSSLLPSRQGSKLVGGRRSRQVSAHSENRLSMTLSRITSRLSGSKGVSSETTSSDPSAPVDDISRLGPNEQVDATLLPAAASPPPAQRLPPLPSTLVAPPPTAPSAIPGPLPPAPQYRSSETGGPIPIRHPETMRAMGAGAAAPGRPDGVNFAGNSPPPVYSSTGPASVSGGLGSSKSKSKRQSKESKDRGRLLRSRRGSGAGASASVAGNGKPPDRECCVM